MIEIRQLKLPLNHTEADLRRKAAKTLRIPEEYIKSIDIIRRSIDARKKDQVSYVYTINVNAAKENQILKKVNSNNIMLTKPAKYQFPEKGSRKLEHSPVIVGSGPAGLFCALSLAKLGYAPIVVERGRDVDARKQDVETFWKEGRLNPGSNVQFGEGGAGTFSDGKLNTMVKDPVGRNRYVLSTFAELGAPQEILYDNKPHIGTDILVTVIRKLRQEIQELGGTFLFETCLTGLEWQGDQICGVTCSQGDKSITLDTEVLVLAIGHSARDTFRLLEEQGFDMEAKAFAVGFRVEHPQEFISVHQYGKEAAKLLPAAPYKVTAQTSLGRGVYSFCMCPGGYVVNSSSEPGMLAVNGMSYSGRDGANANSAMIVSVTPADYKGQGPLAGVQFQQELERRAYELAEGRIPQQLLGDFIQRVNSSGYGDFASCTKGSTTFAPLHELLPDELTEAFVQGMQKVGGSLGGFDRADCILSGVESRTSSPVRISRDQQFQSNRKGCYPCGEGAGYAGGIMSAAMDGMKVAEAIIAEYYK